VPRPKSLVEALEQGGNSCVDENDITSKFQDKSLLWPYLSTHSIVCTHASLFIFTYMHACTCDVSIY
jgi:hypothetical protein